ncbi:hypothetical protein [Streptomyces sp. NPDC059224]|uniref:hypothetical protein n=1 Tax=Streptomyces sp. NPDC059224 TaxID=3346775 RepID=UPI00369A9D00
MAGFVLSAVELLRNTFMASSIGIAHRDVNPLAQAHTAELADLMRTAPQQFVC